MSAPTIALTNVVARNYAGQVTQTLHAEIPPNRDIIAQAMLTYVDHDDSAKGFYANTYISSYVQGGVTNPPNGTQVPTQVLSGHNITEVYITADVKNCTARGTLLVEVF